MDDTDQSAQTQFKYIKKTPLIFLFAAVACLIFLLVSRSVEDGPVTIMVFLASLFLFFVSLASLLVQITLRIMHHPNLASLKLFYTSLTIATGGILLVGLRTLGQLQLVDFVLIVLLEVVLLFYLLRRLS